MMAQNPENVEKMILEVNNRAKKTAKEELQKIRNYF
jgi:Zn-dependent oligopeptidase